MSVPVVTRPSRPTDHAAAATVVVLGGPVPRGVVTYAPPFDEFSGG